ncbi:MAG: GNAT family N-acetyltransferase [Saprospiraceae bacterium]
MKIVCKKFEDLSILELYDILQLRNEVFIVEQNCVYQDLDNKDKLAYHLMIYHSNSLVATTRILGPGISYEEYSSIGRVCTELNARKLNLGRKAMENSIDLIKKLYPKAHIKISAQSYLKKFYTEFGFEEDGEEYLEDNIPHIGMIKKL